VVPPSGIKLLTVERNGVTKFLTVERNGVTKFLTVERDF